jgi:DNA (cytosine-5)-methyltransferase 1
VRTITFGSLFAGIGGMDLGLERAGLRCAWQVEIDDFCRRVLAKHWPDVRRHDDVRTFPPTAPEEWRCDLIAGGFPCQDISNAGKRAGIGGERSGLWGQYARIICILRPRCVLVENVAALLGRGIGTVLGDLAACGYDAEWDCIPASAVGAPHIRDRTFIVGYPSRGRRPAWMVPGADEAGPVPGAGGSVVSHAGSGRQPGRDEQVEQEEAGQQPPRRDDANGFRADVSRADSVGTGLERPRVFGPTPDRVAWGAEPGVCRVASRTTAIVDRLRGLGNAVVPQVAEWIGRRIAESFGEG